MNKPNKINQLADELKALVQAKHGPDERSTRYMSGALLKPGWQTELKRLLGIK